MSTLISIRENILLFFKKYEYFLVFALKFILGCGFFNLIHNIGLYDNRFLVYLKEPIVILLGIIFGVLFTFMPVSVLYFLLIAMVTASLSASFEVAFVVFICLTLILLFYVRLAPKESVFILLTILGFYFKIPYVVPIIAAIYFGITVSIPVIIGVFIWNMAPITRELAETSGVTIEGLESLIELPQALHEVYTSYTNLININQLWVFESLIFAMVIVLVYFVSRLNFDYSKQTSIVLGGILNIVGFLIAFVVTGLDISIWQVVLLTAVSIIVALVIVFFDNVLDYSAAEKVEFEDDEYYYYVRVIPKIKSKKEPAKKSSVKKAPIKKKTETKEDAEDDILERSRKLLEKDIAEARTSGPLVKRVNLKKDEDDKI